MPRQREFDESKALQDAMLAFWERGYDDTSYEDLVKATGVSRYGLYSVFGDKKELFLKTLEQYIEAKHLQLITPLKVEGAAMPEIEIYFETMKMNVGAPEEQSGCMFCNAALEMSQTDKDVEAVIGEAFQESKAVFTKVLETAKLKGQISEDADPDKLGDFLVGLMIGAASLLRTPMAEDQVLNFLDNGLETVKNA